MSDSSKILLKIDKCDTTYPNMYFVLRYKFSVILRNRLVFLRKLQYVKIRQSTM